jgi:hypothetical protein
MSEEKTSIWLIESPLRTFLGRDNNKTHYWYLWTSHDKAMTFPTEWSAEQTMQQIKALNPDLFVHPKTLGLAKPTEHIYFSDKDISDAREASQ